MKKLISEDVDKAGSLEYTKGILNRLYKDALHELRIVEERGEVPN
jgi:hypothetical protein